MSALVARPPMLEQGHTRWLPVGTLTVVFPNAQRRLRRPLIKKIKEAPDYDRIGVLHIMQMDDGRCHIADGHNRKTAIEELYGPNELMQCLVKAGNTAAEAARLFLGDNTDRKAPTALEIFNVSVEGQYEDQVAISNIVKANGFRTVQSDGPKCLRAVGALQQVYRMKNGAKILDDTLRLIGLTWPTDADATDAIILRGMSIFVAEHGDEIDRTFSGKISKAYSAGHLIATARSGKALWGNNSAKSVAALLTVTYNMNKRTKRLAARHDP